MGAADCLDGDFALAVGAHLGGGLCRGLGLGGLFVQGVDGLDDHEQHKCHDEEIDDGVDERADADGHIANVDADIREVRIEEQADGGVDDIIDQRVHDGCERRADDHTNCHVQHVAAHGKGFEFFQKLFDAFDFFSCHSNTAPFTPGGLFFYLL